MRSKWYEFKKEAITLRKRGGSIRYIESKLNIPKSTLSGWFRQIKLSERQNEILQAKRLKGLIRARKKAVIWHNNQKISRLRAAEREALSITNGLNLKDDLILESLLALLYLGEGSKKSPTTSMGNSDPLILQFFLAMLIGKYKIDKNNIRCELHLRADQDSEKIKRFWSKKLKLPISKFKQVSIDRRTINKPTYSTYHGVCIIGCGRIALQRKLVYLSRIICQKVISEYMGG